MTETKHPDVHTPWRPWSEEQTMHVAVAYSNPIRWTTRRTLLNDFRQHAASSANVVGHTAGALMEVDEAQDVDPERFSRDFRPTWDTGWSKGRSAKICRHRDAP